MIVWIGENGLNNDSISGWKQLLSTNSKSFVWNRNDLPVDIFLAVFIKAAPVNVTLPDAINGAVLFLTNF